MQEELAVGLLQLCYGSELALLRFLLHLYEVLEHGFLLLAPFLVSLIHTPLLLQVAVQKTLQAIGLAFPLPDLGARNRPLDDVLLWLGPLAP